MSRPRSTPKKRLLGCLARHRGVATAREIARAHLTGALLEQARQEAAGLVAWENRRRDGARRSTTVGRLTFRGALEAIRLFPGYTPDPRVLISEADLRAVIDQAKEENTPLGRELSGDAEDADRWRRHEAARKAADRAKEKAREERKNRPKPKRGQSQWFRENVLGEEAPTQVERTEQSPSTSREQIPSPPSVMVPQLPTRDQIRPPTDEECLRNAVNSGLTLRPTPGSNGGFCPICHATLPGPHLLVGGSRYGEMKECPNSGRADFMPEQPMAPQPIRTRAGSSPVVDENDPTLDTIERIKLKAKRLGYGAAIMRDGILYDSRKISFEEWDAKVRG